MCYVLSTEPVTNYLISYKKSFKVAVFNKKSKFYVFFEILGYLAT